MQPIAYAGPLDSPLGPLWLAATPQGLRYVVLAADEAAWLAKLPAGVEPHRAAADQPILDAARRQLGEYFCQQRRIFDLPLDLSSGTAFQQEVWRALCQIPFGETRAYSELAGSAGHPRGARAVGQALARNPLLIVAPCHRVLRADGDLGGFGPGLGAKRLLLELEGRRF